MDIVDQFISYASENALTSEQLDRLEQVLHVNRGLSRVVVKERVVSQGYMYAYRIPFIKVFVNPDIGGSSESWYLVKVGRTSAGKCHQRLCGESAIFCGIRQHLTGKPKVSIPSRDGTKYTDQLFEESVHANWATHEDLMFVVACDIGREEEYRCWPTGVGVDVGTGELATIPERLDGDCRFDNLRIKPKALRAWVLGMSLAQGEYGGAPSESLGESEWVIIPKRVFEYARHRPIRTESDLQAFIEISRQVISAQHVVTVELTLEARSDHHTFRFDSSKHAWPRPQ